MFVLAISGIHLHYAYVCKDKARDQYDNAALILKREAEHSGIYFKDVGADIEYDDDEQEFSTVAERVAKAKRDDGQFDVVVAAPNTRWAEELASALRSAGVSSFVHPAIHPWNTDPTTGKTQLSKLLCGLRLAADPKDAPAWRTWCGFGDSMANSPAFNGIRKAAGKRGLSLVEALEALSTGTLPLERGSIGVNRVVDAYCAGIELCRKAQGLRGAELLDRIAGCIRDDERAMAPETFVQLCGAADATSPEQPDAQTMLARFCSSFEAPLPRKDGAVPVLTYREAIGTNAEALIVTGFVNGFTPGGDWFDLTKTPSAKQPQDRLDCARTVAALAGSALKLHPEIIVEDGAMHVGKKYRGKMDKVIEKYVRDKNDDLRKARRDRIFITHSGCGEEIIESIRSQLEELDHFDEILVTRAGGVISSHCGPGTLGVLFIAGE